MLQLVWLPMWMTWPIFFIDDDDMAAAGECSIINVGDIADITEECTENCAHLYFYDKDGNQITAV